MSQQLLVYHIKILLDAIQNFFSRLCNLVIIHSAGMEDWTQLAFLIWSRTKSDTWFAGRAGLALVRRKQILLWNALWWCCFHKKVVAHWVPVNWHLSLLDLDTTVVIMTATTSSFMVFLYSHHCMHQPDIWCSVDYTLIDHMAILVADNAYPKGTCHGLVAIYRVLILGITVKKLWNDDISCSSWECAVQIYCCSSSAVAVSFLHLSSRHDNVLMTLVPYCHAHGGNSFYCCLVHARAPATLHFASCWCAFCFFCECCWCTYI